MWKQFLPLLILAAILSVSFSRPHVAADGNIAYIKDEKEIRVIKADGSGDHQLWTHVNAQPHSGIEDVAWSPDGQQLVFSSGHASATSLFHADLYIIKQDGTGFRKLTNSPDGSLYLKYPKGIVNVTVKNNSYTFQTSNATAGVFFVYVAGADAPQQVIVPPGTSKTVSFKSVADFGNKTQPIVAIYGNYRWFEGGIDVQAGKSVKAPDMNISGDGIEYFGAFRPVWRSDGSEICYRTGVCTVERIPINPPEGDFVYNPMFSGKAPFGTCSFDWGPSPQLANQFIYTENSTESAIYQITEGGEHPGKKLTDYSSIQYQLLHDLHWLPDGSGILYSTSDLMRQSSDIFRYDFKTKETTQVTKLGNEFAKKFDVSPDGTWIVYERSKEHDDDALSDIWIQAMDGTGAKMLIKNARSPSWGK